MQEAKQILHLDDVDLNDAEKLRKRYEQLFDLNDKAKVGSFYLQSKIYRAKERVDKELRGFSSSPKATPPPDDSNPSETKPS